MRYLTTTGFVLIYLVCSNCDSMQSNKDENYPKIFCGKDGEQYLEYWFYDSVLYIYSNDQGIREWNYTISKQNLKITEPGSNRGQIFSILNSCDDRIGILDDYGNKLMLYRTYIKEGVQPIEMDFKADTSFRFDEEALEREILFNQHIQKQ